VTEPFFANFDAERFADKVDAWLAHDETLHLDLAAIVGRAEDEDGFVSVEYAAEGLRDLTLHPKAMRLSSGELAERIKDVLRRASADLERQYVEAMDHAYGEHDNPMRYLDDPERALTQVKRAEDAYNSTFQDVMGRLDHINRRLGH
jgi:hypothetical protein